MQCYLSIINCAVPCIEKRARAGGSFELLHVLRAAEHLVGAERLVNWLHFVCLGSWMIIGVRLDVSFFRGSTSSYPLLF